MISWVVFSREKYIFCEKSTKMRKDATYFLMNTDKVPKIEFCVKKSRKTVAFSVWFVV